MRWRAMMMTYKGAARYKRPLLIYPPPGSLDTMFSAIRRIRHVVRRYKRCPTSRDVAKGKENYFAVQDGYRERVVAFTNHLVGTLRREGYEAHKYSPSSNTQVDTQVSVTIDVYRVQVWHPNADNFYTVIDCNTYFYNVYDVPLSMVPYLEGSEEDDIPIYTMDGLLHRLATFREALEARHHCRTCYYSTEDGRYCGLGADPVGCTHHLQTMEDYDTTNTG